LRVGEYANGTTGQANAADETATKLAYDAVPRDEFGGIAEAARVPVGNVYYYFKTKEELAEAVVKAPEEFRAARAEWDRLSAPKERC